ncbi:MAG: hypothetical protein O3A63_06125 [Proteobacteria bacterium]|nr:hypothetical protein [Pseudomonadota bacterium]
MLIALWHMLSKKTTHNDLGHDYFQQQNQDGIRRHHLRQLRKLGYEVIVKEAA